MLRFGLMGCGSIAKRHANILISGEVEGATLSAVHDVNPERASEFGALGATISGAGPSVLVWTRSDAAAAVAARLGSEARGWADVMRLPFSAGGVEVRTSGI